MDKKQQQLGMPYGTASAKLRKSILFSLVKELKKDICFRCGNKIEEEKDLSIEHKQAWLNTENPKELFFDLDNISFSHLNCNCLAAERVKGLSHPSQESYKRGCRCEECREIEKFRRRKQRQNGIKT